MRLLVLTTALFSFAVLGSAAAQDAEPVETGPSLLVGLGASIQPVYEGSQEYRVAPVPIVAPSFGASDGPRRFEFRGLDDIRIHALYFGRLSVGPLAGYRFGRDEDDSSRLRGLGDVEGGLVVGGFANYGFVETDVTRLGLDVAVSGQVTGDVFDGTPFDRGRDHGLQVDLGTSIDHLATERLRLTGRAGLRFADADYMTTNFGVSPAQAAASPVGLPAFDPGAGLKNAYLQTGLTYNATERFELRAGAGYSRLVGDAADSPVTETPNQFSGFLGAAYRLRF